MKSCKWYAVCPMRWFYEDGKIDKKWIERYCRGNYNDCVRYNQKSRRYLTPIICFLMVKSKRRLWG